MARTARRVLVDAAVVYAGVMVLLWAVQDRLIYPKPAQDRPPGPLTLLTDDGLTLHGWVTHPDAPGALVFFGGNGLRVADMGSILSPCTDRAIYALPYRGYEGQAGAPRERDLVHDGVAWVKQIQRQHRDVAVVGVSLGSGVAAQVAAQTQPSQLLLITPYDRLDRVAQDHLPWAPVRWLMHDAYNTLAVLPQLRRVPISLLQADADEVVDRARTEALVHEIPGGPIAWDHSPTTHNGVWGNQRVCQFLRARLRP